MEHERVRSSKNRFPTEIGRRVFLIAAVLTAAGCAVGGHAVDVSRRRRCVGRWGIAVPRGYLDGGSSLEPTLLTDFRTRAASVDLEFERGLFRVDELATDPRMRMVVQRVKAYSIASIYAEHRDKRELGSAQGIRRTFDRFQAASVLRAASLLAILELEDALSRLDTVARVAWDERMGAFLVA